MQKLEVVPRYSSTYLYANKRMMTLCDKNTHLLGICTQRNSTINSTLGNGESLTAATLDFFRGSLAYFISL